MDTSHDTETRERNALRGDHPTVRGLLTPWTRETCPKNGGRRKGSRNKRSEQAEALGKLLIKRAPDLAGLVRRVSIPRVHRAAIERYQADPAMAVDAMRLATLDALAVALVSGSRKAVRAGAGSTCPRCRRALFGGVAGEPLPLLLGGAVIGWYHPPCLTGALSELVGRARLLVASKLDGR